MGNGANLPQKHDIPKELWSIVTTLSDEAQSAALRKCQELGFDPNKGSIPLAETLINLSRARDILLDAIEKQKLTQLPLKLQRLLYTQAEKAAEYLRALANGTDAVLNLDDAIEELTSSIWQFNLHNLSDQVLGFQNKMNQLKSQEVRIRQVALQAEEFASLHNVAQHLRDQIAEIANNASDQRTALQASADAITSTLSKVVEQEQRVSSLAAQIQQYETTAAQQLANSKLAVADTEAIANKCKELQTEIESTRSTLQKLVSDTQELLTSTDNTVSARVLEFGTKYQEVSAAAQSSISSLTAKLENSIAELTASSAAKTDSAIEQLNAQKQNWEERVSQLIAGSSSQLNQAEAAHDSRLTAQLAEFAVKTDNHLTELSAKFAAETKALADKAEQMISSGNDEVRRLVSELNELEGRIRESIERATGYTLFHSFQTRQLQIAKNKRFWAYALGALVAISLLASLYFIWSLQYVPKYNWAFFLRLSISIPLIYAIAFCNIQYGRERRLEEEYAFKSSISISLDPYQKLVGQLVAKDKPEELSKYTAFIIESVNRVFTSPTERIFEDRSGNVTSVEKLLKALGDLVEPLVKALKSK